MTVIIKVGPYIAVVDDEDAHLAKYTWQPWERDGAVYAQRHKGRTTSTLHREVMGCPPEIVDHRDGNTLDCRRSNLKKVTKSENMQNRSGARCDTSTGFLGVSRCRGKFQASVQHQGKRHYLGVFNTPEEANLARLVKERELWGVHPRRRAAHGIS